MAYFADLTPYQYTLPPGHDPARNVGWLRRATPYPQGSVPPEFVDRLAAYCRDGLFHVWSRVQVCELCSPPHWPEPPALCIGEIRVRAAGGRVYAAPGLLLHYVVQHHYRPPREFIQAVLSAPLPGTPEYQAEMAAYFETLDASRLSPRPALDDPRRLVKVAGGGVLVLLVSIALAALLIFH